MAKKRELLLKEDTIRRMMGIAGIGSLANPFLKEGGRGYGTFDDENIGSEGVWDDDEDLSDVEAEDDGTREFEDEDEMGDEGVDFDFEDEGEEEDEDLFEETNDQFMGEADTDPMQEEKSSVCESCGKVHEGSCKGKMEENLRKSMKRLKKLLEQAELPPPDDEESAEVPDEPAPAAPEMGGEVEAKVKEFVKKLGELVQDTLGVQVTVEDGEEEELPEEAPEEQAPMEEAIQRLVNKVARRVQARLSEGSKAKLKAGEKREEKRRGLAKDKEKLKMKSLKEKQAAAKKKEAEAAKKKKEMEMKKKKAAMAKKK